MSNDLSYTAPLLPAETDTPVGPIWRVPEPPRRFQHIVWKHVLLFLLTLATTTLIGHIAAHITRTGPDRFELMPLRGFAESLWHDLETMAAEFAD